ncbi:FecR family protein [Membranihabitans marinus]|uniref:FecR family protein n=1 Tax=Membranihabitans marinus TaxID=1227546 RepID=UPI001F1CD824|nr:FecR family protein [Membranihabitans marinus]
MSVDSYITIKELLDNPFFIEWAKQRTPHSDQYWKQWLEDNPEKAEGFYKAEIIAKGINFQIPNVSKEKVELELAKLLQQLDGDKKSRQSVKKSIIPLQWKVAAAIVLLVVSSVFTYNFYWNSSEKIVTGYGQRTELTLSDGTEVVLNANSSLEYLRKNPRNVALEGEAFFKVKKKPKTGDKFYVRTSDLNIEVLGTEFNVNTRENQTKVMLEEGKVKIDIEDKESITMAVGDLLTYAKGSDRVKLDRPEKLKVVSSWKDGVLLLDNLSLSDAMKLLQQTYGLEIDFQNKDLENKILQGGVPSDDLDICIRTLNTIYNLNILLIDKTLVVK